MPSENQTSPTTVKIRETFRKIASYRQFTGVTFDDGVFASHSSVYRRLLDQWWAAQPTSVGLFFSQRKSALVWNRLFAATGKIRNCGDFRELFRTFSHNCSLPFLEISNCHLFRINSKKAYLWETVHLPLREKSENLGDFRELFRTFEHNRSLRLLEILNYRLFWINGENAHLWATVHFFTHDFSEFVKRLDTIVVCSFCKFKVVSGFGLTRKKHFCEKPIVCRDRKNQKFGRFYRIFQNF